jgi:hypothetical protein
VASLEVNETNQGLRRVYLTKSTMMEIGFPCARMSNGGARPTYIAKLMTSPIPAPEGIGNEAVAVVLEASPPIETVGAVRSCA